jgi:ferredoxin-NADP reductase/predicted pyridoxine 5'-phosphate oxidase superfamily flavin-nucleotide-binding protein
MRLDETFHEGELLVQQRANEAAIAQRNGGMIADTIVNGALPFIGQQPLAVLGSLDADGKVWASLLVGEPGFLSARDEQAVELDVSQRRSSKDDPFWGNIETNNEVGMLVIELGTRKRLRINGQIRRLDNNRFELHVSQAYPNCPKYIQRRQLIQLAGETAPRPMGVKRGTSLQKDQRELIATADTFFVASANPGHGVDASHRGGQPGFVRVLNKRRIRVPDYVGNSMFNTLGNFAVYPRAGLVFVDFEHSRVLQLTGSVEVLWDLEDPGYETGGTQRFWELEIERWLEIPLPRQLRWELLDYSPHNPKPHRTTSVKQTGLQLAVTKIIQKTDRIKSFRLKTVDGSRLPAFTPGAHLPISIPLADGTSIKRHYSILSDPYERDHYDIAVLLQTEGNGGSRFMHEQVKKDDVIKAEAPQNHFPVSDDAHHSILIAGGIGITPILSMIRVLAAQQASFEVHYAARSALQLAYREEVELLTGGQVRFYLSEGPTAARLNLDQLLSTSHIGTHVYVCGPVRMIAAVRDLAPTRGWRSDQIHFESFGAHSSADDRDIKIRLAKSGRSLSVPRNRTILEVLIEADVHVPYDCKRGECGMCVTEVLEGKPDHRDLCLNTDERKHAMCLCVSRAKDGELLLNL